MGHKRGLKNMAFCMKLNLTTLFTKCCYNIYTIVLSHKKKIPILLTFINSKSRHLINPEI